MAEDIAVAARELLLARLEGVLSTHSHDVPGYPFGSVVQYVADAQGFPVMLISRLAQHTRNLQQNPHCALTLVATGSANVQEAARLTWLGVAEPLPSPSAELKTRYAHFYPESTTYLGMDFDFWRIGLHKARYIGGFAQIHWVEPARLPLPNPFFGAAEESMVVHMNQDHVDAMEKYCARAGIAHTSPPVMAGVDAEGFHLRVDNRLHRFRFPGAADSPGAVRRHLVEMARAS